jgi:hypothetical protein
MPLTRVQPLAHPLPACQPGPATRAIRPQLQPTGLRTAGHAQGKWPLLFAHLFFSYQYVYHFIRHNVWACLNENGGTLSGPPCVSPHDRPCQPCHTIATLSCSARGSDVACACPRASSQTRYPGVPIMALTATATEDASLAPPPAPLVSCSPTCMTCGMACGSKGDGHGGCERTGYPWGQTLVMRHRDAAHDDATCPFMSARVIDRPHWSLSPAAARVFPRESLSLSALFHARLRRSAATSSASWPSKRRRWSSRRAPCGSRTPAARYGRLTRNGARNGRGGLRRGFGFGLTHHLGASLSFHTSQTSFHRPNLSLLVYDKPAGKTREGELALRPAQVHRTPHTPRPSRAATLSSTVILLPTAPLLPAVDVVWLCSAKASPATSRCSWRTSASCPRWAEC